MLFFDLCRARVIVVALLLLWFGWAFMGLGFVRKMRARILELFHDDVWEIVEYQLIGVPRFLLDEFFRYRVLMCAKACFDGENLEIAPPCLRVERLWLI